jgi:flavin reductase (DIM6/NTAB) family NADH-FMN oxidoreductase RutF
MTAERGPVGPFPPEVDPDEYDRRRRRILWTMPSGLYVVGSRSGDRRNGMTLNWATQISDVPKMLGISVQRDALTHELIAGGGSFSLNTIHRDDRAIVRKFTKPVEVDLEARLLNGVPFHDGLTGVPVLDMAVAVLECEVRQAIDFDTHTLFAGEVVFAAFQREEDAPVLRMEDTRMNYGG